MIISNMTYKISKLGQTDLSSLYCLIRGDQ